VIYPVKEKRRAKLETRAQSWLRKRYGWGWGEWWYSTIEPRIFLEKELDLPEDRPGEFKFYAVNGKITHLHAKWQLAEGKATSVYDRDLGFLDLIYRGRPNARQKLPSRVADLASIAEELGQRIDFVRVDLYLDRNDEVWLGELTFAPTNGFGKYSSREFEVECCKEWDFSKYLHSEPALMRSA
jgi:hypothetical protein